MPRPTIATIDLEALRSNLAVAKARAPGAKAWAVVKANAYGHGLERGMRGLSDADGLALIEPEAALQLREMGWKKPVLLLEGFFDMADLRMAASQRVQVAVHSLKQIEMIEGARLASPVTVHLKMNSGMNRLGFTPAAYREAYERIRAVPEVSNVVLMTHFANADDAGNRALPLAEQMRRFETAARGLRGERSICNSAANLLYPELAADWVRPGIMLYGGSPGGGAAESFGLEPAMTLASEIIGVQDLAAGDAVGYGSRFIAGRPLRIGVVACGYADGYPRHAPAGTPVLVDGVRTQIAGRVSMDMLTVDLTPVPGAGIGSRVVLWGVGLPIDEVAQAAGTIGYELMCALAPRVRVVER